MGQEEVADLHSKLDEIHTSLTDHMAREEGWQENIEAKIDDHLAEHKAASERWSNGVVGLVFTMIGAALLAFWELLRTKA